MEKSIESDEYLDYLDETLERQRNFRAVSLDHKSLVIRHIARFNGRIPVDRANSGARLPCLQISLSSHSWWRIWLPARRWCYGGQVCSSRLWRYAEQYMHVQCIFLECDGTIMGRETWNSSWLAATQTKLFCLMNFRALWREFKKKTEIHYN